MEYLMDANGEVPLMAPTISVTSTTLLRSFFIMSSCFALCHGCVTTALALASSELGETLGGYSSGTLYIVYTLTALCGATAILDRLGLKGALVTGCWLYCFYVVIFVVAVLTTKGNSTSNRADNVSEPSVLDWPLAIFGSALGGIASGVLLTAQGAYFATTCNLLVTLKMRDGSERGINSEEDLLQSRLLAKAELTSKLGSYFAAIYLSGECVLTLLVSVIMSKVSPTASYVVFAIIAVLSACGMTFISDLAVLEAALQASDQLPTGEELKQETKEDGDVPCAPTSCEKALAAVHLISSSGKILLLLPQNAAFGFASAFVNQYVNADVVKPYLGTADIGYFQAISSFTAATAALLFSRVSNYVGSKTPVMMLYALCYIGFTTIFVLFQPEQIGRWSILVPLYVTFGLARAIFESTNKAVFADFFPDDIEAAFATVLVFSGGATSIAFFVFPHITKLSMSYIVLAFAVMTTFSYLIANAMNNREFSPRREMHQQRP